MSPLQTDSLELEDIRKIARVVFVSRSATVHEIADRFDLATVCSANMVALDELVGTAKRLRDGAYESQPDDFDGSDVWSAGEILSHLIEMDLASRPFWEATSHLELDAPDNELLIALDRPPTTAKAGAKVAGKLRITTVATLDQIGKSCQGDEQAVHSVLGQSSVKAVVLGNCLHILDHVDQLRAFSDAS